MLPEDVPDTLMITMDDVRKAGHCAAGARRWFNDQGLDFRQFMKAGIPAREMLATGDAQGRQVVERTMGRKLIGADLAGVIITAEDARAAGKCALGSRSFAVRAGLDFAQYLESGIAAVDLIATGDPDAIAVVRHKVGSGRG